MGDAFLKGMLFVMEEACFFACMPVFCIGQYKGFVAPIRVSGLASD